MYNNFTVTIRQGTCNTCDQYALGVSFYPQSDEVRFRHLCKRCDAATFLRAAESQKEAWLKGGEISQ